LGATSATSILRRYLFGVAGAHVAAVYVHVGGSSLVLATHTLSGAQAKTAGVSRTLRYFVGMLQRPLGRPDPPAFITGLDRAGRRIGTPHVNCVGEAAPPACPSNL
jgi:hypothetical protein